MRKIVPALCALLLVCAAAVSCSTAATPVPTPTLTAAVSSPPAVPAATPVPTPSPVPTPAPTPEPTVQPTPSPIPVPAEAQGDKNPDHSWEPAAAGRVDIMMIVPHPDDDQLYLGAILPTYLQQGKTVVTVFMTSSNPQRLQEALNGVYTEGERIYPVFGPCQDKYLPGGHIARNIEQAKRLWPDDETLPFLVEQIRKYKPAVLVSMDVNGEYKNGEHMLTSALVQQVFSLSADKTAYPDSAGQYGAWQAAKLYLHLYKDNKLQLNADTPLPMFDGKTAFQMARLGYICHVSQHKYPTLFVRDKGKSNICDFGLALSKVGYNHTTNDMFEDIAPDTMEKLNP